MTDANTTNTPTGMVPDGLVYELEVSHSMRAKPVHPINEPHEVDIHVKLNGDWSDIVWEFPDGAHELPNLGDGFRGTYSEVSREAERLNSLHTKNQGQNRPARYIFYPTPARLAAA